MIKKFSIAIAAVLLLFIGAEGHVVFNGIPQLGYEETSPPTTGDREYVTMGTHIVSGAVNLINASSKFSNILAYFEGQEDHTELSNQVDYNLLVSRLDEILNLLEGANCEYKDLYYKSIKTPKNPKGIQQLKEFDYHKYFIFRDPTSEYWEVVSFLSTGDLNGLFSKALYNSEKLLIGVRSIRESAQKNQLNHIEYFIVSDAMARAIQFGQYAAEIAYSINKN